MRIRQISVIRGLWFEIILLIIAEQTTDDADLTDLHGYYAFTSEMPVISSS